MRHKGGYSGVSDRQGLLQVASIAVLTALLALPGSAAVPMGFQEANIGPPDTNGSVVINSDGSWTVMGSGNQYDQNTADQLYYLYQSIKGDGSVQMRLIDQASGSQYIGPMIRASTDPGAPFAADVMSTSAVNWIHRTTADDTPVRDGGNTSKFAFPKYMMAQRVGNSLQGFESSDGKLWDPVKPPLNLALGDTALFGVAVSSRSSDLITADIDSVRVLPGVVSVSGVEGAAADKMALITWLPISTAVGYDIYRGAQGATLDKMTLLNTSAPVTDAFYLDTAASAASLRSLSYVVAPVFKGSDGKPFEGPAVRAL
jgi:hypothetical protein